MNIETFNTLVQRRTRKGCDKATSVALLEELISTFQGESLAYALYYHNYATERQADKIVKDASK